MNEKLSMHNLGRLSSDEFKSSEKNKIILVLDNIRSLNNVGSAFRTADAFLIEAIYLCGVTGMPPKPEIEKTALGATETVIWEHKDSITELVHELKSQGIKIASIEQAEKTTFLQDIHTLEYEKIALVFGNEVDGVDQEAIDASDYIIEIPQFGTKHSLNVSVCAGVILWEFAKRYV
jgi:tRNA G18 (ribose-2'-O)-methylase SpoU